MPQLKKDLIDRWLSAYDELNDRTSKPVKNLYAPNRRFDLSDHFIEQRSLSIEKEPGYDFMYGLDNLNRPCYFEHKNRKGYYTYTDELAEYVEYNNGMPYSIQRITYSGDKKISFQSISNNREAGGTTKTEILDNLLKDEFALYYAFEVYHYTDGHISSADCLYRSPAEKEYELQKSYRYNETGELEEILDTYADNKLVYSYVRTPDNISIEELSEQVASQIAADIMLTLPEITGILEIDFMEIGLFSPLLAIYPDVKSIEELLELDPEQTAVKGTFDRLLCAFMREVDNLEDHALAVEMTRQTARILNKTQRQFLAYAKDWDTEEDELINVFKACGWPEEETSQWVL